MEGGAGVTTMGGAGSFAAIRSVNQKNTTATTDTLSAKELTEVEMLPISGKYNSLIIAKNIATDIALFNHYNPGFDVMMASTGSYDLRLPPDKMQLFVTNKYSILNECVQKLLGGATVPANRVDYPATMSRKKSIK
jgi:membrane-bound lytic murein transglycosylase D